MGTGIIKESIADKAAKQERRHLDGQETRTGGEQQEGLQRMAEWQFEDVGGCKDITHERLLQILMRYIIRYFLQKDIHNNRLFPYA